MAARKDFMPGMDARSFTTLTNEEGTQKVKPDELASP